MCQFSKNKTVVSILLINLVISIYTGNLFANIVTNGSFENTEVDTVSDYDIDGWWISIEASLGDAALFEIVDDTFQEGNHALKVTINSLGTNDWDIQLIADSIAVTQGATYKYSIWCKTDSRAAKVHLTVGNYNYEEYGRLHETTLTNTWQEFTMTFTVTDQQTSIRAPIHFGLSGNAGDVIYIDNLKIVDVEKELLSRNAILVEADSGDVGSDFAILEDGDTRYISIQTDQADFTPSIPEFPGFVRRTATCDVTFPAAGTYDLFARIRVGAETYDDDSFFYANDFGIQDTVNADDWIAVNGLAAAGFSEPANVVADAGGIGEGVWKWVNLSKNSYQDPATSFTVEEDDAILTFQIGAREDGLDIDKLAFGRSDLYFTVGNLENEEAGSEDLPGEIYEGPPLAQGKSKFLGSAHSSVQATNFASYWNQVTPENGSKWGSVEGTRDQMSWSALDAAYQLAKDNGLPFRFHVLIWGNQQPSWMASLSDKPEEQLEEIREWFEAVNARYPDIDYLEVVNEPLHDPPDGPDDGQYINALGGKGSTGWDWILNAFRMAREIFPETTKLMINEYNIIGSSSNVQKYMQIINLLKNEDLIDCIGVQAHAFSTRVPAATMRTNLNTLAASGLTIQATEMDVDGPTDQVQLNDYKKIFPVFWEHPDVVGVTLWGWRPGLWRNSTAAYLLNLEGEERPALEWLRDYVTSDVAVEPSNITRQKDLGLFQNYPNPFNPATEIGYQISEQGHVRLTIYNILGRQMAVLVDEVQSAGIYTARFNPNTQENVSSASAVYFYTLETNGRRLTNKMLYLR